MQVKLSGPDITEAEVNAVQRVLTSGWLSLGPELPAFEKAFAEYLGCKHAIACNSGTSALHMMMLTAGIGPGDEVITSSFSFIASANCIEMVGAKPVFVDVDPETKNLDPARLESALTERTRAILAVHIFGRSADMAAINAFASRHNLMVLEDACESLGARARGRMVGDGSEGLAAAWGFYPNKQMTTGEGGMVTTNDDAFALSIKKLRNQGRNPEAGWLEHDVVGYNFRLDEMSCALGRVQIGRMEELIAGRQHVADAYRAGLESVQDLVRPLADPPADERRSWFVYTVEFDASFDRDAIAQELADHGIQTGKYFVPPIHLQRCYVEKYGYKRGDLPVTEAIADRILALPFTTSLGAASIDYVCKHLIRCVRDESSRFKKA